MLLEEAACAQTTAHREASVTLVVLNTIMASEPIDTVPLLKTFLDGVDEYEGEPPSLYVDLEGSSLSRNGTLSLVTTLIVPREKVDLIDVTTLGQMPSILPDRTDAPRKASWNPARS